MLDFLYLLYICNFEKKKERKRPLFWSGGPGSLVITRSRRSQPPKRVTSRLS